MVFVSGWLWRTYSNWPIHEGWQTLKDEKVGALIQYPSDFQIRKDSDKSISFYYHGKTQSLGTEIYDGILVSVMKDELGDGGMSKYIERNMEQTKTMGSVVKPLTPISINEIGGFTYTAQTLGDYEIIFLPSGKDEVLVVSYINPDPEKVGYQEIVDDMLSTLKIVK